MLGLDRHFERLERRFYDTHEDVICEAVERTKAECDAELERQLCREELRRRASLRRIMRLAAYRYAVTALSVRSGRERDRLLRWCQWCKNLEARL